MEKQALLYENPFYTHVKEHVREFHERDCGNTAHLAVWALSEGNFLL